MKPLLFYIALLFSSCLYAQTDIDTLFTGMVGERGKAIRKDSAGTWYQYDYDKTKIHYFSNKWYYKMYDTHGRLLVEGQIGSRICSQLVSKSGKWTSYYPNGKVKTEGYYESVNKHIGRWRHFYPNGQPAKIYTLERTELESIPGICMIGAYEEYYENGQLKVSGQYKAVLDSVPVPLYDSSGNELKKKGFAVIPQSKACGVWKYFHPSGQLLKKEDY